MTASPCRVCRLDEIYHTNGAVHWMAGYFCNSRNRFASMTRLVCERFRPFLAWPAWEAQAKIANDARYRDWLASSGQPPPRIETAFTFAIKSHWEDK